MMPVWLLLTLTVFTVARLTRLGTTDYLLDPVRAWAARHAPDSVVYLFNCPWCLSVHIGAVVAPVVYVWHDRWWVQIPLIAFAASYLTGLLEQGSSVLTHTDQALDS